MSAPVCPTCRTPYHQETVAPGTKIVCDSCMEEFLSGELKTAGPEPLALEGASKPAKKAKKAKPAEEQKSASATGRLTGAPKTPDKPKEPEKAQPKKARRHDDDDDYDFDEPRKRRRAQSDGSRGVIYAAAAAGLLLLLVCVGVGAWMFMRASNTRDREQQVRARVITEQQQAEAMRANPIPPPPAPAPAPAPKRPGPAPALGFPGIADPFTAPAGPPDAPPPPPARPVAVAPEVPVAVAPAPRAVPLVPPFEEPPNPFKVGTQTKLRELRTVKLPAAPAPAPGIAGLWLGHATDQTPIVYSPRHQLLFVRHTASVWVYDLKADKVVGTRAPTNGFSDMSLSPDEAALFVADYGGERTGYGNPLKPSEVHRFDLAARTWEARKAPKIAYRIEAVDAHRVLLLEQDQWVALTLNKWETDGVGVRELARLGCGYSGDIEYDPRTGRVYHGNRGLSSQEISVRQMEGDKLKMVGDTGAYGTAHKSGPTVVLSQDGSRFYYGPLQVDTKDVKKNLERFPEVIYAASRDVAFGASAYYRATTGSKLGDFAFKTTGDPKDPRSTAPPALTVSRDGMSVWVIDRDKNLARQFALEGEE